MTIKLDRDVSQNVGACLVESLRTGYRFDVATGLFVTPAEFVRAGAPGPPDLAPRPGERKVDAEPGVSFFLAGRYVRLVLGDEAPLRIQRDFRTQALNVFCDNGSATARFPARSRELIARFRGETTPTDRASCGVETEITGTEAHTPFGVSAAP